MKQRWIYCGLLIAGGLFPQTSARSQEGGPRQEALPSPLPLLPSELPPAPPAFVPSPPACGSSCASCAERTLPVPRMTLMEQQSATTIPRMKVREETIGKACGLEVKYREVKQVVTEWSLKPREVIQEVPCTTMVPVTTTDPCTGECRTEYKSCPIVRSVKITVYDTVPVERLVVVSVPCLVPGKPLLVKRLVVDSTVEPGICTRLQLLTVPNEVRVPSCPVCPSPHP